MEEVGQKQFIAEQKALCEQLQKEEVDNVTTGVWCPPVFDGILCWPRTTAPSTANNFCPEGFVLARHSQGAVVTKTCLTTGQWFVNPNNVTWSNYSLCTVADLGVEHNEFNTTSNSKLLHQWLPIIKTVSQVGYASSFTTLIIALAIFSLHRKLRNPRNRLHMHLFLSFIMRAFMALLKDWLFVDGIGLTWDVVLVDGKSTFIKENNTWACKAITSVWQYFIVANYAWILMEGLYLHNLVFYALCTDTTAITLYVFLGWGLPFLVVAPWIAVRATMENILCWTTNNNSSLFLIIRIPILISILFNFILFINIVRVLLVKLKTSVYLQRKKMRYRRWAKSTLVLVPLFGAHYTLFLGLSYHEDHRVELLWLFCDQLFASFQGCFVALLYCLLNSEVRAEVRRAWKAQKSRRSADNLSIGLRDLPRSSNPLRPNSSRHRGRNNDFNAKTRDTDDIKQESVREIG